MEYHIKIKKSAIRELSELSKEAATKVAKAIDNLKYTPYPVGYLKIRGSNNHYRIRVGDYRIIYTIENQVLVIEIIKIGHRKSVYKIR